MLMSAFNLHFRTLVVELEMELGEFGQLSVQQNRKVSCAEPRPAQPLARSLPLQAGWSRGSPQERNTLILAEPRSEVTCTSETEDELCQFMYYCQC